MAMRSQAADLGLMRHALTLAEQSVGLASPNPQVGCVLVRDGLVLGAGAHRYEQHDHAEIVALKAAAAAGHDLRGATAYVTLEPCSHHGRTGPCADALIHAQVARVVVATVDPNPQVSGRGIAKLRAAGIEVELGVLEAEARGLNDAFALSITLRRPFVTLKAALSVDGCLAPAEHMRQAGEPFWLTGPEARAEVHRMRHAADAVLTGIGTVLADDPLLTDRSGLQRRRPLLRVVLDTQLRMPPDAKMLGNGGSGEVCLFCAEDAAQGRDDELSRRGVMVRRVKTAPPPAAKDDRRGQPEVGGAVKGLDLSRVLSMLYESFQVTSVLLEGGSRVNGAFLEAGLVDRAVLFYSETELGTDALPFARSDLGAVSPFALEQRMLAVVRRSFGADVMVAGNLREPWASVARPGTASR